jgi:L-fuconolactonase
VQPLDAHHHLWRLDRPGHEWLDGPGRDHLVRDFVPEDMAAAAAGTGIEESIVVQVLTRQDETVELLRIAARTDRIVAVVGWVDLAADSAPDCLAALRASVGGQHLVGIRHHQTFDDNDMIGWLNRPGTRAGLRSLSELGLVFDLLVHVGDLIAAADVVTEHPQLSFVLNHLGRPFAPGADREAWVTGIAALAAQPNVYCKLSGLVNLHLPLGQLSPVVSPYVDTVLERFGPARVLFGSDWPMWTGLYSYPDVVGLAADVLKSLSETERAEVMGGTARRVYRIADRY